MRVFYRLLLNSLLSGVTSTFLWFALTFWVYLETRSVVAASVVGSIFMLATASLGMVFGTFVDHHRKHTSMLLATGLSTAAYGAAALQYAVVRGDDLLRLRSPHFWVFVALILIGSVSGNLRSIALGTCVTLLVPEDRRDRANGMVGTITGVSFALTSIFSGLVIGQLGMGWAVALSVAATALAFADLTTIRISEPEPQAAEGGSRTRVDFGAAIESVRAVPGLVALIAFAAFNNLLGGVFMSLMDAYGLSLVSVETLGLLWGLLSMGFIVGGLIVARRGLGPSPMRVLIAGNLVNWAVCSVFTLRSSIIMLAVGCFVWLTMIPMIEAAEQTVLQRTVPFERQGRVFGLAQTVEGATTPVTAFLVGPLAEVVFIPFMTTGVGVSAIGSWFGTGPERGLALIFTLSGMLGVAVTVVAWRSRSYNRLATHTSAASVPGYSLR